MMKKLILLLFITATNCRIIEVSQNLNHVKENNQWNKILQIEKKGMIHKLAEEEKNRFKQNGGNLEITSNERMQEFTHLKPLIETVTNTNNSNTFDTFIGELVSNQPDQAQVKLTDSEKNNGIAENTAEDTQTDLLKNDIYKSGFLNLPDQVLNYSNNVSAEIDNSNEETNPEPKNVKINEKLEGSADFVEPDQVYGELEDTDVHYKISEECIEGCSESFPYRETSQESGFSNSDGNDFEGSGASNLPDWVSTNFNDSISMEENSHDQNNLLFGDNIIEPYQNTTKQGQNILQTDQDVERSYNDADSLNHTTIKSIQESENYHQTTKKPVTNSGKLNVDSPVTDQEPHLNFSDSKIELEKFNLNDSKNVSNNLIINNDNPVQMPDQDTFDPDRNVDENDIYYSGYVFEPLSLSNEHQTSMPDQDIPENIDVISETNNFYSDQEHFIDLNNSSVVTINFKDQIEPDLHIINFNISDKPDQLKNETFKYINFLKEIGINVNITNKSLRNSTNNDNNTNKFSEIVIVLNVPLDDNKQDN